MATQQHPQPLPFVSHPRQRDPQACALRPQAPRVHQVRIEEDGEGTRYALCVCGWVSSGTPRGYGFPSLVCDVWECEREGRRNRARFLEAGGPVES